MPCYDHVGSRSLEFSDLLTKLTVNAAEGRAQDLKTLALELRCKLFIKRFKPRTRLGAAAAVVVQFYIKRQKTYFYF